MTNHAFTRTMLFICSMAVLAIVAAIIMIVQLSRPITPASHITHDATHLAFGDPYKTDTGITITVAPPVPDGNGGLTSFVNEVNNGHHAYMLTNQFFKIGDSTDAPALPFSMLYPHRQVTYTLNFINAAPGPVTYYPDSGNQHSIPITWSDE